MWRATKTRLKQALEVERGSGAPGARRLVELMAEPRLDGQMGTAAAPRDRLRHGQCPARGGDAAPPGLTGPPPGEAQPSVPRAQGGPRPET